MQQVVEAGRQLLADVLVSGMVVEVDELVGVVAPVVDLADRLRAYDEFVSAGDERALLQREMVAVELTDDVLPPRLGVGAPLQIQQRATVNDLGAIQAREVEDRRRNVDEGDERIGLPAVGHRGDVNEQGDVEDVVVGGRSLVVEPVRAVNSPWSAVKKMLVSSRSPCRSSSSSSSPTSW